MDQFWMIRNYEIREFEPIRRGIIVLNTDGTIAKDGKPRIVP